MRQKLAERGKNGSPAIENLIIGVSSQIRKTISTARKIAQSASITTLITGESGTGKDLFARLIHNLSSRGREPFIDINCGALPEALLESELFGYEKGAFTGAHQQKPGLFELANGGTIFLDEIGNTSPGLQAHLLKAVEQKRFRRINGLEEVSISTRIIAATNMDLYEAVKKGRFREDLYYRLNVCQIKVPPLRERGNDVIILAEHFIERFNREYNRSVRGLSQAAMALLRHYPWPGNVRQLRNAVERAVLIDAVDWIEPEHIVLDAVRQRPDAQILRASLIAPVGLAFNPVEIPKTGLSLENLERDILLSALQMTRGNLSEAARLLKMKRGKLRYRLQRIGIAPEDIRRFKATAGQAM